MKKESLRVLTIAMICPPLTSSINLEPSGTSMMELLYKITNGFYVLINFLTKLLVFTWLLNPSRFLF